MRFCVIDACFCTLRFNTGVKSTVGNIISARETPFASEIRSIISPASFSVAAFNSFVILLLQRCPHSATWAALLYAIVTLIDNLNYPTFTTPLGIFVKKLMASNFAMLMISVILESFI
ncbi:hypothetical protein, unlikely [Trypanosoma brucei brucei TREU927]|uniref:Uncharacterized protein n=1 Tax=Trypanosoma brucei brucei (strain 927/4 GUTat10.1) TaxID=185431 RepID=Q38CM6_TRYB2|nr:hypothetical protein, unlikely [Trypanosoma brucei brucei TREU927]EAN77444.1 hypothetical protein, unlikely [Trypanosoma brucei brucei TREU927]